MTIIYKGHALAKLQVGILIMALTITTIVLFTAFRVSYMKKLRRDTILNFYDDYDEYFDTQFSPPKSQDRITQLKRKVREANERQVIYNKHRFGKVRPTTYVIAIHVHEDINYLSGLVYSLKYTMGITNSLLIFCHDYYDDEINRFIRNITFAKFIQIYYPFSTQLYPSSFPGNDPYLCTDDFECEMSVMRVERQIQNKHFWWWQKSRIFDHLEAMKNYNGTIIFLQEDQFVLNDFIFMLTISESLMIDHCPQCEVISLGSLKADISQFSIKEANLTATQWNSFHNMGLAFNRSVWNSMRRHRHHFCRFNDYSWEESLKNLALRRPEGIFVVLSSDAPRVIQYKCSDYVYCTVEKKLERMMDFAKTVKKALYPTRAMVKFDEKPVSDIKEGGGWEDVRDQELCMHF